MKKFITLAVILATVSMANAQLKTGNFLIGSDIAGFRLALNDENTFHIDLSPKAAIFVRPNLALGAYLRFELTTAKEAGTDIGYGLGALGRYYISDPKINVLRHSRFFFEGTVGIDGNNPASGDNTNGLGVGFGPGLAYFITPNVGLETMLKYQGIVGFGQRVTTSELMLSVGLQIYLPFSRAEERIKENQ